MKVKIGKITGCSQAFSVEVSSQELEQKFEQVYVDIGKFARIPGFRPGKAPRDLLQTHYRRRAEEEVIKRAIPDYYLKAVVQEKLSPVAPPEIENVQFRDHTLYFRAKVDVRPQVKIKGYKNLRVIKKEIKIKEDQIDEALERLRQSRKKDVLDEQFAKDLGFKTLQDLRSAINKNLQANAERETKINVEGQIFDQLLERTCLDVPETLVGRQMQELTNQLKWQRSLRGEGKGDAQAPSEKELNEEARKEAVRRVKLSFILDEVAQRENIQASEEDLDKRIEAIAQGSGKDKEEVKKYLQAQNLIAGLKAELRDGKTIEFLLKEAKIVEK